MSQSALDDAATPHHASNATDTPAAASTVEATASSRIKCVLHPDCLRLFPSVRAMHTHVGTCHPTGVVSEPRLLCTKAPRCCYSTTKRGDLEDHIRRHSNRSGSSAGDSSGEYVQCRRCDFSLPHWMERVMLRHRAMVHGETMEAASASSASQAAVDAGRARKDGKRAAGSEKQSNAPVKAPRVDVVVAPATTGAAAPAMVRSAPCPFHSLDVRVPPHHRILCLKLPLGRRPIVWS